MRNRLLLTTGITLLFVAEILRAYLVMPFPGSQYKNTIALAYWISENMGWLRILGLVLVIVPLLHIFKTGKIWKKAIFSTVALVYGAIFIFFNYKYEADKMFRAPKQKNFAVAQADTTDKQKLVIGVALDGVAKAYPIQIIGYHHQIMDTIGHTPVMVTYCTVCRTGRVYSPFLNGKKQSFRLVGMDHFNAVFEDSATGSWLQQATGKVIAGPLKGASIKELESKQVTLAAWLREYPNSYVMQPDPSFKKNYNALENYDDGTIKGSLQKRDSASWKSKSWVIGVQANNAAKAYDWNNLMKSTLINDSVKGLPVVLALENDSASFHVYNRLVKGIALKFEKAANDLFTDTGTHSTWNMDGVCIAGAMKGEKLNPVQAYQEFWHSWSTFHPNTVKYN